MLVESTMLTLGEPAADFELPDPQGTIVRLSDFSGSRGLLVMFLCNHCPYVKHIASDLARLAADYAERGVAVVAINANDWDAYPADAPERMVAAAREWGMSCPYVCDETQEVARAYRAACTPDLYLFDAERRLYYRGQFDDSRPDNGKDVTGADLQAALDALMEGHPSPRPQHPSAGCSIKWRPGKGPDGQKGSLATGAGDPRRTP